MPNTNHNYPNILTPRELANFRAVQRQFAGLKVWVRDQTTGDTVFEGMVPSEWDTLDLETPNPVIVEYTSGGYVWAEVVKPTAEQKLTLTLP